MKTISCQRATLRCVGFLGAANDLRRTASFAVALIAISIAVLAYSAHAQTQFSSDFEKIKYLNNQLVLAQKAMQSGDIDQSVSILNSAVTIDPTQDLLWFKLGETYRLSGDYNKAIAAYQKATQIKPTQGAYHNNLADAYMKSKRIDDALSEYALAAQVDGTNAATYIFNMGLSLQTTEDHGRRFLHSRLRSGSILRGRMLITKKASIC